MLQSTVRTHLPNKTTINLCQPCLGGILCIALISTIQPVRKVPDTIHGRLHSQINLSRYISQHKQQHQAEPA